MSVAQSIGGAIGVGVVVAAIAGAIVPDVSVPEKPIVVHTLEVDLERGMVKQDRTITTDAPWFAQYVAAIINADTRIAVPRCTGTGTWTYATGRFDVDMLVSEWTGNPLCRLRDLPPGRYFPEVTFRGGTDYVTARGSVFTVENE